jgi:hypothetical protein
VTRFRQVYAGRRTRLAAGLVATFVGILTSGYFVVAALAAPTAPTITVAFPANTGVYNATGWSAGCSPAGICGTTSGAVTSVTVGIIQSSTGLYWNGSSFQPGQVFNPATGTASWEYAFTPPQDGHYRVVVRANYGVSSHTSVTVRFQYKTAPPPPPRITSKPPNPTSATSADFKFVDGQWPNVTFWCWVDSGAVQDCTGGSGTEGEFQVSGLTAGQHCFSVYAIDLAGNNSVPTTYCWTVLGASPTFSVGGSLTSPLYPGTSEALDLTFTNPSSSAITIAAGAIGSSNIAITTNHAGCPGSNFAVTQGLTTSETIPAEQVAPISLSGLHVPQTDWPVIAMIDTHTNQNACEGATLTLTYSGIEASG